MKKIGDFDIQFAGLKEGKHEYDYHLDNSFFEEFDYDEFNHARVDVHLLLHKKTTLLELFFTVGGSVNVNCDVSNEPYDQALNGTLELVVKFGEHYNDDEDDMVVLPYGAHQINVSKYIYETVILAVPYKKIHPHVADGTMKSAILDKLKELSPGNGKSGQQKIDPRWDILKELLNEN